MDNHTIEILNKFECATFPTGSRFICDPPVMNTDEDTVVFVDALLRSSLDRELREYGFKVPYGREYDALANDFTSYKKDEINLIVTWKQEFYDKYVHATLCAKRLNLIHKEDRIKLFEGIIYERYGDMKIPGEEEEEKVPRLRLDILPADFINNNLNPFHAINNQWVIFDDIPQAAPVNPVRDIQLNWLQERRNNWREQR